MTYVDTNNQVPSWVHLPMTQALGAMPYVGPPTRFVVSHFLGGKHPEVLQLKQKYAQIGIMCHVASLIVAFIGTTSPFPLIGSAFLATLCIRWELDVIRNPAGSSRFDNRLSKSK